MSSVQNDLTKMLSAYKKDMLMEVKYAVLDAGDELEDSATRDAPSFITMKKTATKGLKGYEVKVNVEADPDEASALAAYFEFGTGLSAIQILAPYPQYIKDIARLFYVDGSGRLKGKPYLFSNLLRIEPLLVAKLKKLLKDGR